MIPRLRFFPDETKFDFIRYHIISFIIAAALVLGSFGLVFTSGLNLGVDFTGGTLIEVKSEKPIAPDLANLRESVNNLNVGSVSIQEFGQPDIFMIRVPQQHGGDVENKAALEKIKSAIQETLQGQTVEYRRTEYVGPQVGEELKRAGIIAFLLATVGILVYVWVRFEWQFGLAAVIALAHDAVLTVGFLALTGYEFDLSTMGAVLLVAGYSINDTVVIFDRIRENMRKYRKMTMAEICNLSVNQTMSRTIMTALSTLLGLIALAAMGGEVIQGFTVAMIAGIVFGVFSSVYIASALLLYLNLRREPEAEGAAEAA